MFPVEEILRHVPHRYPFLLIDRVLDFRPHETVEVLKNVSIGEPQLQGHFPGLPILPGVYLIENMAQAACFLLAKSRGGPGEGVYGLGRVNRVSFKFAVRPGDQLITRVVIEKRVGDQAIVSAECRVGGREVARGELVFGLLKADA